MENRDRCPSCGALVRPEEKFCSQCGAPLTQDAGAANADAGAWPQAGAVGSSGWRPGMRPCTIDQLKDFCAYNEMPLERMRFFVDQDYREPRAFGIYREGDRCVVYKNKDDGSRAVRYNGPDEAHAVGELYDKLLDECHKRNIWPDGRPEAMEQEVQRAHREMRRRMLPIAIVTVLLIGTLGFIFMRVDSKLHANDGYYRFNDAGIYYCFGEDWYYDDGYNGWTLTDSGPYDSYDDRSGYYIGDTYDNRWGYSDFTESEAWNRIQEENRTTSQDYNNWDAGETDWGTDW